MPDVLIVADTVRSPELRHEVPLTVPDPFLYAEVGGKRSVVVSSLEAGRIRDLATDLEVLTLEDAGLLAVSLIAMAQGAATHRLRKPDDVGPERTVELVEEKSRTETALTIFGITPATSGEILVDGKAVNVMNMRPPEIAAAWERGDIDAVSGARPVLLSRADGHALVANTAALKAAGDGADSAKLIRLGLRELAR